MSGGTILLLMSLASSQMERVALMAGVRVSLEKGEGREAILLIEGFPQGCRRARGIIQVVVIAPFPEIRFLKLSNQIRSFPRSS